MTAATVVGSGPNGLAAALTLADAGVSVVVYEAEAELGGGTRSAELTLPGLIHDECSAAHPLAVDNAFTRRFDLGEHGLRWCWPEVQYSHPLDGGAGAAAFRSVDETAALLGDAGRLWRSTVGWAADRFDAIAENAFTPVLQPPSHPLLMARFGAMSALPASVFARALRSPEAAALFAGVAAHAMRPLSGPMTSAVGVTLGAAGHRYGWPVAEGGSRAISDALVSACRARGVRFETGVRVESLSDLSPVDVVMLDVSPRAAASICGSRLPDGVSRALRRYRYGPAAFKVDFAVDGGGIPWTHEPSRRSATVHVGGSSGEVAAGEAMVARGQMPERPFVLVCQQHVADPTRARGDVVPVWSYAHVPAGWQGDATEAIIAQIERFAPGFRDRVLALHVRSVADTEAHDANFIGGDIAIGANDPKQLLFRPRVAVDPYSLGATGLFICSAATPPGAGAHGLCGYQAAQSALRQLR